MSEKITVRNTLNGLVAEVSREVLNNPHLAKHLVEVEKGANPINLAKPTTAEEYKTRRGDAESRKKDLPKKDSKELQEKPDKEKDN